MELKNMDTSDIWRELFIPVDWDARKCYNSVKIEFVGEKYRTWQMYAYISKTSSGEVEIEFTCIYITMTRIICSKKLIPLILLKS